MGNILGFLTNAKIKAKLFLLLGVSIGGFVLFTLFSFSTLNELKINGKLYKRIVQGKDLIADVLPPPEYIIETYLISLQLIDETNPQTINSLIEKAKSLKGNMIPAMTTGLMKNSAAPPVIRNSGTPL